jgi:hypothetical protein
MIVPKIYVYAVLFDNAVILIFLTRKTARRVVQHMAPRHPPKSFRVVRAKLTLFDK